MSGSLQSPGAQSNRSSVSSQSTSALSDVTSSASEWSRDYSRMSRYVLRFSLTDYYIKMSVRAPASNATTFWSAGAHAVSIEARNKVCCKLSLQL